MFPWYTGCSKHDTPIIKLHLLTTCWILRNSLVVSCFHNVPLNQICHPDLLHPILPILLGLQFASTSRYAYEMFQGVQDLIACKLGEGPDPEMEMISTVHCLKTWSSNISKIFFSFSKSVHYFHMYSESGIILKELKWLDQMKEKCKTLDGHIKKLEQLYENGKAVELLHEPALAICDWVFYNLCLIANHNVLPGSPLIIMTGTPAAD